MGRHGLRLRDKGDKTVSRSAAVVVVTTSFPVGGDGREAAGSFVSDFAGALAELVPVRVVAPGRAAGHEARGDHLDVFRFPAPEKPLSTLKPWVPRDLAAIRSVLTDGNSAVMRAVKFDRTAHILALWAFPSGHWARRVSGCTGVPYSVWTLGSDIWSLGRIPVLRGYLRRVLRNAHQCYSDGLKLAEDTARIGQRKVEFLPSTRRIGTVPGPLASDAPYRLLFLGRWHRNKGVDLLLDALLQLEDDDWGRIGSVAVCGGGPLEQVVHSKVAALRAAGRPIELRGYLGKEEAEIEILRADYVLIPSRVESIPVVFSDAMKLGRPVVSMPVGDLPQLVNDGATCGVLADAVSAEAFRHALASALRVSPADFSVAVTERAAIFDLSAIATRTVDDLFGGSSLKCGISRPGHSEPAEHA